MVLIAIWPVQKSENAVHLTGHKDSGTKQILRDKWRPAGTGFEGSKFRDFSVPPGHMACMYFSSVPPVTMEHPREDAGGLSREYVLRIPSVS